MGKKSASTTIAVRLRTAHFFTAPAERVVSTRFSEPAQIIVMMSGTYKAHPAGQKEAIEARAGEIVYWPASAARTEENDPKKPTRCISLYFSWRNAMSNLPYVVKDSKGVVRLLAQRLLSLKGHFPPLPPAISNAYLAAIVAEFVRLARLREDNLVAKVAFYTEEHMSHSFTLKNLADHVGLEEHHFGRKYKALTGHSPMQYVRHRRTEHALGLLTIQPKRSLKNIASRVGIGDAHQLRRLMRKLFGLSIRELRRGPK